MSMRNIPIRILRPTVRTIYSGPIKRVGDSLGLTSTFANFYWSLLYRISRDTIQHNIDGISVEFNTRSRAEFARNENLMDEKPVIVDILSKVHSGDVFFDIGANTGVYTCILAAVLSKNQVFAFEPHPANISGLESNLQLNNLTANVHQYALTAKNRELELAVSGDDIGIGTHSTTDSANGETIPVSGRRGDFLVQQKGIRQPSIIKIDVEGAEYDVIQGLKDTLSDSRCRLLYCEVHPDRMGEDATPQKLKSTLSEAGFEIDCIHGRDNEYFIRGYK